VGRRRNLVLILFLYFSFGVFSVLGALQQIPQMINGPPCWTCPDSKIDLAAIAGGDCMDGWSEVGNTYCDDSQSPKAFWCLSTYVYNDQASCEGAGNTWAPYTCEDNNHYWVEENPTSGSSTECSANNGVQAMHSSACCSNDNDGPSAPPFTTPIAFALQLIVGILMVVSGGILSCCGGPPTTGKLKCAMVTSSIAAFLYFIFMILCIVGVAGMSDLEGLLSEGAINFFRIFLIVAVVWCLIMTILLAVHVAMIARAKAAGIGKSDVPSI